MNITELLFGLLIGIILVFNLKITYHGVNSGWLIKTFENLKIELVDC